MVTTYFMGAFNDNFFKQAALLLAVSAGVGHLQGTATALFSLPFIACSAYAGWFADRYTKKNVIISAKLLELLAMLIGAAGIIFSNWGCILSMIFLMGLQSTLFGPALNGSIPEHFPDEQIPKVNGLIKTATTIAVLLGIAFAGFALDQDNSSLWNLPAGQLLVGCSAILISIIGIIASFAINKHQTSTSKRSFPWLGPIHSIHDVIRLRKDLPLLLAVLSDAIFYFIASITILAVNSLGIEQLGLSKSSTSLLTVALMIGVATGSLFSSRLYKTKQWKKVLIPGTCGMSIGLMATSMAAQLPLHLQQPALLTAMAVTGFCGGFFLIPITSFIQTRPAKNDKGMIIATTNFCAFTGILVAGQIYSWLAPSFSATNLLQMLSALCALTSAGYAITLWHGKQLLYTFALFTMRTGLKLRYKIETRGLDDIHIDKNKSILFLPNHPAMVDPVILMTLLHKKYSPRPLADQDQVNRPFLRSIMRLVNAITLPNIFTNGRKSRHNINQILDKCVQALKKGDNLLFYPAGKLYRSANENLGGNSGVEYIMRKIPNQQIILARTSGLWGSTFSWADGTIPNPLSEWKKILCFAFANLLAFAPRRKIEIDFYQPTDFPRHADRLTINRYLEKFYNMNQAGNTKVPLFWWQGNNPETIMEPNLEKSIRNLDHVSAKTRTQVTDYLEDLAGITDIRQNDLLSQDLGIDSLKLMDTALWLENEFGTPQEDFTSLNTVGDCILAACGENTGNARSIKNKIASNWFSETGSSALHIPEGKTIAQVFLKQAALTPDKSILADQISGVKTYRDLITAIMILKPFIKDIPDQNIGIMLPASLSASLAYLTTMFSGKTPVMINWTVGTSHMQHCLQESDVKHIITASALLEKLEDQGTDLSETPVKWIKLDELKKRISLPAKIKAVVKSRFNWNSLKKAQISDTAAILFTSGSEANPKSVPLSHSNILANMRDFSTMLSFRENDRLLGILPPFHSLGLAGTCLMPLCMGLRTVYHSNPTEGAVLAGLTQKYLASLVIGTPTFLQGIIRNSSKEQLSSLRLAFTGAEKCPDHVYQSFNETCPKAVLCEGYGITECSPVVSVNQIESPKPGTIGKILPTMEYILVDPDSWEEVPINKQGLLLVKGPNVFSGYLQDINSKPFVTLHGKKWYNTGDLVKQDEQKHLTFCGRLKRFIKLGGEMISLPAIESILQKHYPGEEDMGPALAVEATPSEEKPELVLFSTFKIDRQEVNRTLREAGLSALHNIKQLILLDAIPVLGTGKTDYRQLKTTL